MLRLGLTILEEFPTFSSFSFSICVHILQFSLASFLLCVLSPFKPFLLYLSDSYKLKRKKKNQNKKKQKTIASNSFELLTLP